MTPGPDWLAERIALLVPVWLSLSVHEWAHAFAAWRLGDDTAARLGRLTLNPLAHLDPLGTVLLPLLGVPFGWAKPVPINPLRFDRRVRMGTGVAVTAAAGPLSNFVLALFAVLALAVLCRLELEGAAWLGALKQLLYTLVVVNVGLGAFNLFPIPPLDGSRIAEALVPEHLRAVWDGYSSLAPFFLVALIALPALLGVSLLAWPMREVHTLLRALLPPGSL